MADQTEKIEPTPLSLKAVGNLKNDAAFGGDASQEKQFVSKLAWTDRTGDAGIYNGEVNTLNQPSGFGVVQLQNGDKYEGQWENGVKQGEGIYYWPTGAVYNGEFLDNLMYGKGEYSWPDGQSYKGEFVNGVKDGYGTQTWPSGDTYHGYYKQDERHGKGCYVTKDGAILHEGEWKDGDPIDPRTM